VKTLSTGLIVVLLAFQRAPEPGAIAGIVMKAGTAIEQPLRNARLELSGSRMGWVARTDGNGRFAFLNLPPGEYRLTITCDGFIRQEHKKILLAPAKREDIRFDLESAPTASGRVLDNYGEAIGNVMVEALRRSYDVRGNARMTRVATAVTDDRGEYRIFWLDPGEYFFYAGATLSDDPEKPAGAYTTTYYPDVSSPEDAKSLRLEIGREIRVDFRLRRAAQWTVRGQTMSAVTSRSLGASISLTPPAEDPTFSRFRAQSVPDPPLPGEFSIGNVGPGSYIVMAKGRFNGQDVTAFEHIVLRSLPYAPPPSRPPTYTVTLKLSPSLSVNGRLFIEGGEPLDLRDAIVTLTSIDPDLPSPRTVRTRADGRFMVNEAVAGSYVVDLTNLPEDLYLKAARFGEEDVLEKPIGLEYRSAGNPLQILVGMDGGHLQVAAYDANGTLHPSAQFVLVPDAARRARRDQYRIATAGEDGQSILLGIPPGSYKLFAWEELEPNAYLNADYLRLYEPLGVPVSIRSGDNSAISTRIIPKQ
jgi:carboxypeptidase family protein